MRNKPPKYLQNGEIFAIPGKGKQKEMVKIREFQEKDQDEAYAIWKHGMSVDLTEYWVCS